jgi:serine/threonine protein kinase
VYNLIDYEDSIDSIKKIEENVKKNEESINHIDNNTNKHKNVNKIKINTTYIDDGRLEKNIDDFKKIGQGGFGSVLKAKHKIDGSDYAIKMIELNVPQSQNLMEHKVIKEVKTMMKLNHKNVVRYTTCWFQLNIEVISHLLEVESSVMTSVSKTKNFTKNKSKSLFISHSYNYSQSKLTLNIVKDKISLNQISENEENNVSKSEELGFNWEETKSNKNDSNLFFVENKKVNNNNNNKYLEIDGNDTDKALSVSFEKLYESDSTSHIETKEKEHARDDSQITNKRFINKKEPRYKVFFFMQMEYCDGLPLNLYLENHKDTGLDRRLVYLFFKQIVSGVNHIHRNNVIHRDLK